MFSLFTNVVLILPGLPLMIVIGSYVQQRGLLLIAIILAITSWAASARVLRSQTLSIRNRDYVQAAKIAGEKPHRIIAVEILPNLLPVMSSGFVFALITAILGEAGLSFIGLGVNGTQTWGSMLFYAQNGQALTLGRLVVVRAAGPDDRRPRRRAVADQLLHRRHHQSPPAERPEAAQAGQAGR